MNLEDIKRAVAKLQTIGNNPNHSWEFNFNDGKKGSASVRLDDCPEGSVVSCCVNGRVKMQFKLNEFTEKLEQILTTGRASDLINNVLSPKLWVRFTVGEDRIWLSNPTKIGGTHQCFTIPLGEVIKVMEMLQTVTEKPGVFVSACFRDLVEQVNRSSTPCAVTLAEAVPVE